MDAEKKEEVEKEEARSSPSEDEDVSHSPMCFVSCLSTFSGTLHRRATPM